MNRKSLLPFQSPFVSFIRKLTKDLINPVNPVKRLLDKIDRSDPPPRQKNGGQEGRRASRIDRDHVLPFRIKDGNISLKSKRI
jgi:hypothetical protein